MSILCDFCPISSSEEAFCDLFMTSDDCSVDLDKNEEYPNIIEEDSLGGTFQLDNDADLLDDAMTIDPIPYADYKTSINILSLPMDDETSTSIQNFPSPQACRRVVTPYKRPLDLTEIDDDCESKRSRYSIQFDALPPLPQHQDCDFSLMQSLTIPEDESVIEEHCFEQCSIASEIEEQIENEIFLRQGLKNLIVSMRKSEASRVQLLNHVERLPELYSPYENGVLVDTDLETFFDSQESGEDVMTYAFDKLVEMDEKSFSDV